jgi:hypothetical protein
MEPRGIGRNVPEAEEVVLFLHFGAPKCRRGGEFAAERFMYILNSFDYGFRAITEASRTVTR